MELLKSFIYAWQGIKYCYKTQLNLRIHLVGLSIVIIAAFGFKISSTEWLFIIGCSMLVLVLELVNTAIEVLCDIVTKEIHPMIKIIKDIAAAAVLIAATGSAITGAIIFFPKIISFFKL